MLCSPCLLALYCVPQWFSLTVLAEDNHEHVGRVLALDIGSLLLSAHRLKPALWTYGRCFPEHLLRPLAQVGHIGSNQGTMLTVKGC